MSLASKKLSSNSTGITVIWEECVSCWILNQSLLFYDTALNEAAFVGSRQQGIFTRLCVVQENSGCPWESVGHDQVLNTNSSSSQAKQPIQLIRSPYQKPSGRQSPIAEWTVFIKQQWRGSLRGQTFSCNFGWNDCIELRLRVSSSNKLTTILFPSHAPEMTPEMPSSTAPVWHV